MNGTAYTGGGGVIDVTSQPVRQLGTYLFSGAPYDTGGVLEPAFGQTFYLGSLSGGAYSSFTPSGVAVFDRATFLLNRFLPLNIAGVDGTGTVTGVDVMRWGRDGIAALTSSGTLYLLRGPGVIPQLLQTSSAPVLNAGSVPALQHGVKNVLLTVTGSNFLPGIAAMWNGAYRTTTFVDSSHMTVAIPAADLAVTGAASLTAINPGSASSAAVAVPIH